MPTTFTDTPGVYAPNLNGPVPVGVVASSSPRPPVVPGAQMPMLGAASCSGRRRLGNRELDLHHLVTVGAGGVLLQAPDGVLAAGGGLHHRHHRLGIQGLPLWNVTPGRRVNRHRIGDGASHLVARPGATPNPG